MKLRDSGYIPPMVNGVIQIAGCPLLGMVCPHCGHHTGTANFQIDGGGLFIRCPDCGERIKMDANYWIYGKSLEEKP